MSANKTQDSNQVIADGVGKIASKQAPAWLKPILDNLGPISAKIGVIVDIVGKYVIIAYNKSLQFYKLLAPYHPNLLLNLFIGLSMILFGGHFMLLLAVIEAYRMCGWTETKQHFITLYQNYVNLKSVLDKDNAVDDNKDGVADVLQISESELLTRRLKLFMQSCNPNELAGTMGSIYAGFIAMLATVKLQFARTISLGVSLGEAVSKPVTEYVTPYAQNYVPQQYHQWIGGAISYAFKLVAMWLAMYQQRVISAFNAAVRGASLFTSTLSQYATIYGYAHLADEQKMKYLGYVLVSYGVYSQVTSAFRLGLVFGFLLSPVVAVESIINYFVAFESIQ